MTTGTDNTALGDNSGTGNVGGSQNTYIGSSTGTTSTLTGSNNTCVGFNAEPSVNTVSNEITLGNSSITTLRCADSTISTFSDRRDKTEIKPLDYGLDFIEKISS